MVKNHLRLTSTVRFASAALVVALASCDPAPSYSVPEQPVVGMILSEQSRMVTADAQPIALHFTCADLSGPAGAYPVGTRVTLRLLGSLPMQREAGESFLTSPIQAVQILPARPAPAATLQVVFHYGPQSGDFAIFHAVEGDAAWTRTGVAVPATSAGLPFSASAPGLWMAVSANSGSTGGSPDGGRD